MKEPTAQDTKKKDVKIQENVSQDSGQDSAAPDCDCQGNTKKIYDVT